MDLPNLNAEEIEQRLERLRARIEPYRRVAVAFSAGVDSTVVLAVASRLRGADTVALTAVSPSLPRAELEEAVALARRLGARLVLLESHELEDPRYAENSDMRCYFCKHTEYGQFSEWIAQNGFDVLLDGTNRDDTGDFRPGRKAAREYGVVSPLLEADLGKAEVRALAFSLDLPNWNKPAMACLSSRVPHGTPVTAALLGRIERAEDLLHQLGIAQARVRHHDTVARVEIEPEDFPRLLETRARVVAGLRALGWHHVSLDLDGYRTGSLNEKANEDDGQRQLALHSD